MTIIRKRSAAEKELLEAFTRATGFKSYDKRRDRLIWLDFVLHYDYKFNPSPTESEIIYDLCCIRFPDGYLDGIEAQLLSKNELGWIVDSKRQLAWLKTALSKRYDIPRRSNELSPERYLSGLNNKEASTLVFDLIQDDCHEKTTVARNLANQWKRDSSPTKSIRWFEDQTKLKIEIFNKLRQFKNNSLSKSNPASTIEDIEIILDTHRANGKETDFDELIRKTKAAFAKDKHNQKNKKLNKKPYNMVLPIKLMEKVQEMADSRGISAAQMVIEILRAEIEK
ncbi:hypothetical protein ACQUQU_08205 [Thalassolituus sp. LLYu03]|uniref:hypothetical protein n=1 Tax=Thalassolituus sp. LLYu03 TaxID=3421656 RepID=UPI003D2D40FB